MKRVDFNAGWIFQGVTGKNVRPDGEKEVVLPHDAMLSEPRKEENPGKHNTGYFAGNDYLYTRHFFAPQSWKEKKILLEFEGVYHNAEVFLNGKKAAGRPYGYTNFWVDADAFLQYGTQNRLEVIAHNADQPNSRWYSGAGIYRPVWMYIGEKEYIFPAGVQIHTRSIFRGGAHEYAAKLELKVRTSSCGKLKVEIRKDNELIAVRQEETDGEKKILLDLTNVQLWAPDHPELYTYHIEFIGRKGGEEDGFDADTDSCEGSFGIRMLEWNEKKGFCINGERVILRGACIHHDNGLLGACCYPEAEERKVHILKENGYNAVRSAHNPCSKALLEACDRLGMLVMDEYVDMWYIHKTAYDYALSFEQWWRNDLKDMVEKDYNHPCVVLYSIGNEVAETAQERGIRLTEEMTEYLHRLDDTRPVTCGINLFFNYLYSMGFGVYSDKKAKNEKRKKSAPVGSEFYNTLAGILGDTVMKLGAMLPGSDAKTREAYSRLDIAGYNYGIFRYDHDLKKYPGRLILGSETFCKDANFFYEKAKRHPRIIGDFVWAGMDYLGETGVGAWEYGDYAPRRASRAGWLTAGSGRIDITGTPLGEALYTKVAFDCSEGPFIAVRPVYQKGRHSPSAWKMTNAIASWSWRGCEGSQATVEVYTKAYAVGLYLNGCLLKRKKRGKDCRVLFRIPYENGELKAVAYDKDGLKLSCASLFTAGKETVLRTVPEKNSVRPGGLCFVRIRYTDEKGIVKPMERHFVKVEVSGGKLLGLGNGCPYNPAGYLCDITDTYYGEALAIIQAREERIITITATDGTLTASSEIIIAWE